MILHNLKFDNISVEIDKKRFGLFKIFIAPRPLYGLVLSHPKFKSDHKLSIL